MREGKIQQAEEEKKDQQEADKPENVNHNKSLSLDLGIRKDESFDDDVRFSMDFSARPFVSPRYVDTNYNTLDLSKSVYNPNLSTMRFMSEIDIRCDDHIKLKEDVQATRFCTECKLLCCDSCVIEYHHSHIASAKTKVEEYFKKQKNEMEDLKSKISNSIRHKNLLAELQQSLDSNDRLITNYFSKRKSCLENLKNRIDVLLIEENELMIKMRENIQSFYRDESQRRLDKPIKEMEDFLNKIQIFIREWEIYNRTEKARVLKNDTLKEFKTHANELNDVIKNSVDLFKSKSKALENNLIELLKIISYSDKISDIESSFIEISTRLKNSFSSANKLTYDELDLEEKVKSNDLKEEKKIELIEDNKIQNEMNSLRTSCSFPPCYPQLKASEVIPNKNDIIQNNIDNSISSNLSIDSSKLIISDINIKQNVHPYYLENNNNYEVLMGIKNKSDEVVIYEPKNIGLITVKIKPNFFQDPVKSFTIFPENCRYVNLHSSLLITGGYVNREVVNLCYLLIFSKKDKNFEINIIPYGNMIQARERHNILNLHDRNQVLVCSGFFNYNAEITDLNVGTWRNAGKLSQIRGNATISYINKKYVYVIGGFRINERQQGEYQNSCEVLSLDSLEKGWKYISFDNYKWNIKLSAMGIINISEDSILLCGGYDGYQYRNDVFKMNFKDMDVVKYEKFNLNLPSNLIFIHNNYVRIDDLAYNFDLHMNVIIYNPVTNTFKMHNMIK